MNVSKMTTDAARFCANGIAQTAKKVTVPLQADSKELAASLKCLAANAIPVVKQNKKVDLPEYLYHLTSKENYENILKTGKFIVSDWETMSSNGCPGVYFIDKDNFLNAWMKQMVSPEIFGSMEGKPNPTYGELLVTWTVKGADYVKLRIPTKKLDAAKMRFRPFVEVCRESMEKLNPETMEIDSDLVKKGLPIEDLKKYKGTNEPIEYVYQAEIPADFIDEVKSSKVLDLSIDNIISNLFD